MWVSSALSSTSCTNCGGTKYTPSRSATTKSPGITVALPMRMGTLIPVIITLSIGVGSTERKYAGMSICANSLQIADAAVHYQTAAMRGLHHVIKKIVAHDGAVNFFAEQIYNQYVSRLQHVDCGLIS